MSITSILCDPNDPNVYTPPQYDNHAVKQEAVVLPVVEPPPLVTRTPPPLQFLHPFFADIEYHTSDESDNEPDEEEIEEIPTISTDSDALIRTPKRRRLNSYVPSDAYDLHLPHDELRMWDFYDKVTCKILSCKNASGENPWRDDLIARATASAPLKHALFALTSFHIKRHQPQDAWAMASYGLNHTNAAFRALHQVMSTSRRFDENNMAAMLVLSFSQVGCSLDHN